jgi:prolyl-tRNA synthetase
MTKALKIYKELKKKGIDVLLDDADDNIANKFKKHDLLGIPFQIIVGSKATKDKFEFKEIDKKSQMLNLNKIIKLLKN